MASILQKKNKPVVKAKKVPETEKKFEDRDDIKRLVLYIVIVNFGQSSSVIKLLKTNHSSAQFIRVGEGTASKQIREILSIEDNRKEIIYSLLREDCVPDFKKEIEAYFAASKKNKGVAFTVKLDSIVGVKLYKFLSQTVRG